ncbi:MAG: LON peptidase substrate-binding domain-containing protein [Acidimicrobiales bacterium]
MALLPQFPLGTVLFPTMVLPLHVFEPRYRALVHDVIEGDRAFGVVLIERGSEVGGHDKRSMFGTVATILDAEQFSDGRWALYTVGGERFRVDRWLDDTPYPQAEITLWPDEAPVGDVEDLYRRVAAKFGRCMALASESGLDVGPVPAAADDVGVGCMQMSALGPFATFDKQALLGAPGPTDRLALLDRMIDDALELIRARLTED